jgi:hypothetical protein
MSDLTTEDFRPAAASPSYPAVNPGQDGELRKEADEVLRSGIITISQTVFKPSGNCSGFWRFQIEGRTALLETVQSRNRVELLKRFLGDPDRC